MSVTYTGISMSYYCSVWYHVFNSCTFEMSCFLSRVDYFGIILHLIGCMLTLVYFVYYHHPTLLRFYVSLFAVVGLVCLTMNYHSMFSSITRNMSGHRRTLFFSLVAILSLPPQVELSFRHYPLHLTTTAYLTDAAYIAAALVYWLKYPERLCPGRYDLLNSHTIFHIIVVIAGLGSVRSLSLISYHEVTRGGN